jgi:hypothetical protein
VLGIGVPDLPAAGQHDRRERLGQLAMGRASGLGDDRVGVRQQHERRHHAGVRAQEFGGHLDDVPHRGGETGVDRQGLEHPPLLLGDPGHLPAVRRAQQVVLAVHPRVDGADGDGATLGHLGQREGRRASLDQQRDRGVDGAVERGPAALLLRLAGEGARRRHGDARYGRKRAGIDVRDALETCRGRSAPRSCRSDGPTPA